VSTVFVAVPLDRTARIVTRLVWVLGAGFLIAGVVALFASAWLVALALLASALAIGALIAWYLPRQPVVYELDPAALVVRRRRSSPWSFTSAFSHARSGRLGLRLAGDGGVYGYAGKFRADGKTVSAFVTSTANVVVLSVGDRNLAVSPADPDEFIAAAGRLA
jgi:hypothetical protein